MQVSVSLSNAPAPELLPSEADALRPFLVKSRDPRELDPRVVMLVPSDGRNRSVLFVAEDDLNFSDTKYLDQSYTFVRYLGTDESFTIYGVED